MSTVMQTRKLTERFPNDVMRGRIRSDETQAHIEITFQHGDLGREIFDELADGCGKIIVRTLKQLTRLTNGNQISKEPPRD